MFKIFVIYGENRQIFRKEKKYFTDYKGKHD